MSTNFYTFCRCCDSNTKHLGQSAGPAINFLLQANGYQDYHDWPSMQEWLEGRPIRNEYGDEVSLDEFKEWVEYRREHGTPRLSFGPDEHVRSIDGYEFHDGEFF